MNEHVAEAKFPIPVDRNDVAQSWRARGFSCQLFSDPPGREWNDFVHATNELVTVLDGRLELILGETRVEAGPGDEVYIARDVVHSVRNIHPGQTRWLFGYD